MSVPGASFSEMLLALPSRSQEGAGSSEHMASHFHTPEASGRQRISVVLPSLRWKNTSEASSSFIYISRPGHMPHVPHAEAERLAGEAR